MIFNKVLNLSNLRLVTLNCLPTVIYTSKRSLANKNLKKFYKKVSIGQNKDGYEVLLDTRKLKTPMGKLFVVPNEALALAVAAEWNMQEVEIKKHLMYLTSLCYTSIDNPAERSRDTLIGGILEYLATDTVCYRVTEPTDLANLQNREWNPLIRWMYDRFGVHIKVTNDFAALHVSPQTLAILRQHLNSYGDWSLVGYQQAVECLKSFIVASALLERHVSVEQACQLARLETEYQVARWGQVEWHHGVELSDLQARLAAAAVFVQLTSTDTKVVFDKHKSRDPV